MGMRVIVADGHPEVRSALRLLLEEKLGINAISEASKTDDLLRMVKFASPDLLLLDWELPGIQPEKLMPSLRQLCPQTSIIALSSRSQTKTAALYAGARDFVCKTEPPEKVQIVLNRFIPQQPPSLPGD